MALQPVTRRSVPEDVFEQILAEVLSGEMQPGESLPSERRLAEVLGVSLVTNLAAGMTGEPLRHDEVLAAGRESARDLGDLLARIVAAL